MTSESTLAMLVALECMDCDDIMEGLVSDWTDLGEESIDCGEDRPF